MDFTSNDKKYFYMDAGGIQHGPFNLEELIAAGISHSTNVWYDGQIGWIPAMEIPELEAHLPGAPMAQQKTLSKAPADKIHENRPLTYRGLSVISLFLGMPIALVSFIFSVLVIFKWNASNYAGATLCSKIAKIVAITSLSLAIIINVLCVIMYGIPFFCIAYYITSMFICETF